MLELTRPQIELTHRPPLTLAAAGPPPSFDTVPPFTQHRTTGSTSKPLNLQGFKNALAELAPLPRPGEAIHAVVDRRFVPCDMIPAILELDAPANCLALTITTLGLNAKNIATITQALDARRILTARILVSSVFSEKDKPLFNHAKHEIEARGGLLKHTRNHTKIILMKMDNAAAYVIEGSANLRSCNSIEQFSLHNDPDLLDFHSGWIDAYIRSIGDGESRPKPRPKWHR